MPEFAEAPTEPIKYNLLVYGGQDRTEPLMSLTTWDGYDIKGDWICTYGNGLMISFKLPPEADYITISEIKPDPLTDPIGSVDALLETTQPHDTAAAAAEVIPDESAE